MIKSDSELLQSAFGTFRLRRETPRNSKIQKSGRALTYKAWNAADEYLLNILRPVVNKAHAILILNDNFGALTTCLAQFSPVFVSDSYSARSACKHNLSINPATDQKETEAGARIQFFDCLTMPKQRFDFVILHVPKSHALLEEQLYRLREVIRHDTQIIATGMVKYIHRNALQLFEQIIGPTHTSLAQKKARLIFCQPAPESWKGKSPYPSCYQLEGTEHWLANHANVFSHSQLDQGTRLFLAHINKLPAAKKLIDLACGNGVLGISAKLAKPSSQVHFYDESYMAVASAKQNYMAIFKHSKCDSGAEFTVENCLGNTPTESVDIVLNNPPFHQQHAIGDDIAWRMFVQSKAALRKGGELWVVGNRHLNYHAGLKRLFGNCELVASNRKFVLLRARKLKT